MLTRTEDIEAHALHRQAGRPTAIARHWWAAILFDEVVGLGFDWPYPTFAIQSEPATAPSTFSVLTSSATTRRRDHQCRLVQPRAPFRAKWRQSGRLDGDLGLSMWF